MKLSVIAAPAPWTKEQEQILRLAYECAILATSHPVLEEGMMGGLKDLAKEPFKAANKWGKGQAKRHNEVWDNIQNAHAADPTGMGGWKVAGQALHQDTPNLRAAGKLGMKGLKGAGKLGMGALKGIGGGLKALGGAYLDRIRNGGGTKQVGSRGGVGGTGGAGGGAPKWGGFGGDTAKIYKAFLTILGELDQISGSQAQKQAIDNLGKELQSKSIALARSGTWTP